MTSDEREEELLARLAEDFCEEERRGTSPRVEDFVRAHPRLAGQIREVFPVLQLLEGRGAVPDEDEASRLLARIMDREETFGRYELGAEVDAGGQGTILRAVDMDLRREVAMKVMGGSGARRYGGSRNVSRFVEEAQVTAQLDHPCVVPVHELGQTPEGRAYFTMKLIEGETLESVIEKVARMEGGWTVTRAAGVVLRVCEAVAFAHARGVIHRDLKPANVMVGRYGEVYVMDWGLARVRSVGDARGDGRREEIQSERLDQAIEDGDSPLLTREGDVLGTLSYMSPEQAAGDLEAVGALSDVYSIGAILHHLITGRRPNSAVVEERSRRSAPQRRVAMERLGTEVSEANTPSELAAIRDKAMAVDPVDRYGSMQALGDDLRAFLEGRVVGAFEAGAFAQLKKWIARNKGLAASALAIVALSLGGTGAVGLVEARGRRLAQEQRDVAEAVVEFLEADLLGSAELQRGRNSDDILFRDILDRAALRADIAAREGGRFHDKPLVEAAVRGSLGFSYSQIGSLKESEPHLLRALDLRRAELGEEHADTLRSMLDLGILYSEVGPLDEAEELLRRAWEVGERTVGETHDTLWALCMLGNVERSRGRYQRALETYERAYERCRSVLGPAAALTVGVLGNVPRTLVDLGRDEEADRAFQEALKVHRQSLEAHDLLTIDLMSDYGRFLWRSAGKDREAEEILRDAFQLGSASYGLANDHTYSVLNNLLSFLLAKEAYEEILDLYDPWLTSNPWLLQGDGYGIPLPAFRIMVVAGRAYDRLGMREHALRTTGRALEIRRQLARRDGAGAEELCAYASLLLSCEPVSLRDPVLALEVAREAREVAGATNWKALGVLAAAQAANGDPESAASSLDSALELLPDSSTRRTEFEERLRRYRSEQDN